MAKEGGGMESLGTVLAVAGWTSTLMAFIVWARSLFEWLEWGGGEGLFVWLLSFLGIVASLAVAGIGHLLRAMAQLGRNVRRIGEALRRQG